MSLCCFIFFKIQSLPLFVGIIIDKKQFKYNNNTSTHLIRRDSQL